MPNCCVVGCKVRGGHLFPKDSDLKTKWIQAIGRENWKPTKDAVICSCHFEPNAYLHEGYQSGLTLKRKRLKADAIPNIFPPVVHEPTIRFKRETGDAQPDSLVGQEPHVTTPGVARFGFVDVERVRPLDADSHHEVDPLLLSRVRSYGLPDHSRGIKRELPDDVKWELPDNVKRELPDNVKRELPDNMKRELQDDMKREPPRVKPDSPTSLCGTLRTDTGRVPEGALYNTSRPYNPRFNVATACNETSQ